MCFPFPLYRLFQEVVLGLVGGAQSLPFFSYYSFVFKERLGENKNNGIDMISLPLLYKESDILCFFNGGNEK